MCVGFEVFGGVFHAVRNHNLCGKVIDYVEFFEAAEFFEVQNVAFDEFCFWVVFDVFMCSVG